MKRILFPIALSLLSHFGCGGSGTDDDTDGTADSDPTDTEIPDTDLVDSDSDVVDTDTDATPSGGGLSDSFDGSGPLVDYVTNNPDSLPDVARADGRYRANLVDNTNNITLHFNGDQGRLDAKLIDFPFDVAVRNIGIGTQADSQVAPPPSGDPYVFAGVQVHVPELESRNSSHIVVGHRGGTHFTVEGKNTVEGSSSVNDVGFNAVPAGRADIRVVGNADHTLTIHWQVPNLDPGNTPDNWTLYGGSGDLPGNAPAYGPSVYVGLITYAFNQTGVPFVGTCDAIEEL